MVQHGLEHDRVFDIGKVFYTRSREKRRIESFKYVFKWACQVYYQSKALFTLVIVKVFYYVVPSLYKYIISSYLNPAVTGWKCSGVKHSFIISHGGLWPPLPMT